MQLLVLIFTGKPAYVMNKDDIDWAPCLELGHSKSREKEVANAEERAKRAQARRKKSMGSHHCLLKNHLVQLTK